MAEKIYNVSANAGIKRDGTEFDANEYADGVWVRFQRGRPRKIRGFSEMIGSLSDVSRGMFLSTVDGQNMLASGTQSGVDLVTFDVYGSNVSKSSYLFSYDIPLSALPSGNMLPVYLNGDPTKEFTTSGDHLVYPGVPPSIADPNNLWQFDVAYSPVTGQQSLLAHPGKNLNDITSDTPSAVFFGALDGSSPMYALYDLQEVFNTATPPVQTSWTAVPIEVSGGVKYLTPFIFVFGSGGLIKNCSFNAQKMMVEPYHWSGADYPLANEQNVGPSKVVAALPIRGGANSPSGLFWSLDQLTRVSFASGNAGNTGVYWRYDQVDTSISVMSSQAIILVDGIYYWPGNDRWFMYNGVVRDIPNEMNFNYFFDGLNYEQRQKIWAINNPRWGEIWFYYPRGSSAECNDAIIFNYREQIWFDAGMGDGANRSAGAYSQAFRWPVMADWRPYTVPASNSGSPSVNRWSLFRHEFGTDAVQNGKTRPVYSSFTTCDISYLGQNEVPGRGSGPYWAPNENRWTRVIRVEPDFKQNGEMSLYVVGRGYANDQIVDTSVAFPFTNETPKIDMREQRRLMQFKYESNVIGGDYEAGKIMYILEPGDERGTGI